MSERCQTADGPSVCSHCPVSSTTPYLTLPLDRQMVETVSVTFVCVTASLLICCRYALSCAVSPNHLKFFLIISVGVSSFFGRKTVLRLSQTCVYIPVNIAGTMKQFQLWDEACGLQFVTATTHTFFSFVLPASPLLAYGFRAPIGRLCEAVLHICCLRVPGLGEAYLSAYLSMKWG